MDLKNRAVSVTGAGGFIGRHLAERLVELGAKTRALWSTIAAMVHGAGWTNLRIKTISIGQLVELISKLAGRQVPVETDQKRKRPPQSEINRLVADAALARATIGWEPRESPEDGLRTTIEFVRANLARYRPGAYVV